jgi:hypothetical protein
MLLSLLVLATWFAPAFAANITYTEEATATGLFGGVPFSNAFLTITAFGSTNGAGVCTGVPNCTVNQGPITVNVEGVGFGTITPTNPNANNPYRMGVVDNQGSQVAGMSDFGLGFLILFTSSPAFAAWNITTPIGPVTGPALFTSGQAFPTSFGSFVLTSVATSTFTATIAAVPEPDVASALLAGLVLVYAMTRRARKPAR